ncbi:MAG: hypothetical protein JSR98_16075 [Proteobacteria bacterium]|nr:hypothetical protein [Pseudomonadota bacterium]
MLRTGGAAAVIAISLSLLAGCALGERGDASRAIAKFLAAVDAGDRAAFEADLDRKALRADLAEQMAGLGRAKGLDIGEPPSEFVLDRMVSLQAVKTAAARTAPNWPARPTAQQIVPHMKVRDGKNVCLEEQATKRCLLAFTKRDGAWRLSAMPSRAAWAQTPGQAL